MQIEGKERVIVGVNDFINVEETAPDLLRVDPALGQRQAAKLAKLRATRDNNAVASLLVKLEAGARGTDNLIPIMVECVEARVTLGEISHCLRSVWGEQREPVFI
jgi:methylmalonyl-CoA mutase N-terminal domain/subunit